MYGFIILIISVGIYFYFVKFFLNYLIQDKEIFFDNEFDKPQSFHNHKVIKVGGVIFIFLPIFYLAIDNYYNFSPYLFKLFFTPLMLLSIGLLSDIKLLESAKIRLCLIILLTLGIVYILNYSSFFLIYLNIDHNYLKIFEIIFISFVIISIINGSNFFDGLNGLLLSNTFLVIVVITFIDIKYNNSNYILFLIGINTFVFLLFLSNYPLAKLFLGDIGAYFIGCLVGVLIFKYFEINILLAPVLLNLAIYPLTEVSFSFFRKLIELKSPFLPDRLHLHMVIFNYVNKYIKDTAKSNYLTSTYMIIFLIIFYTNVIVFIDNYLIQNILSISFILIYMTSYYVLKRLYTS